MNTKTSQPILCGTDFSEHSRKAGVVAAALSKRLDIPLLLVHAKNLVGGSSPEIYEAGVKNYREQLHQEADYLRELGASVEEIFYDGVPDEVLVLLAQERQARLIVVASTGTRAPVRWLLGSVAARTAESASVPTLVVRAAAPFEAWARGERALKIFVAADFTATSDAALRWVADLRQLGPCEVLAGYVDWPPEEANRRGMRGFYENYNPPELQRILERDLAKKVGRFLPGEGVRTEVQGNWGNAGVPLEEMATKAEADLVVVGAHRWHGLAKAHVSISRHFLHHSPMSVVCVPSSSVPTLTGPRIRNCQRVLVAVDLAETDGFAATYGYSIVAPGGVVRLFHNIEPFSTPNPIFGIEYEKSAAYLEHVRFRDGADAKLATLAPEKNDARGIVTETEITESYGAAVAICAAAERFDADVICIGSHTKFGLSAQLLGSIALEVLQTSRRPVLVVRPPEQD